ncbi:hypothetical protein C8R46DRAFT_981882 [Mycena filopes]|nr:hypothetical protein C8R46DRAFT_981882 [Mycena filopes]
MHGNTSYVVGVRRPEFWTPQPWDKLIIESPHQIFPEDDLLHTLVKIYFDQINPVLGVLHAPSFNQSVADGLHLRDRSFGSVLLVVCALGSRYSEDRRVLLEGATSQHSCGWKWFRQVLPIADRFVAEHALRQLQLICLSISYLGGSDIATPAEQFVLAGLGLRFAHAAGVNQRSGYAAMDPLTAELSRRVVWILIISDTIMSSFKGQPSITQSSANFDLDLPVDCDEEYWAVQGAVQPPGVPASGAFLPVYIQLMMIFGRIQGAVYPVHGQICSEDVVVELDSALNRWLDVIPEHLKWDPHQENQVFLTQSAVLYSTYYHAQVLIHRPFISGPGQDMLSTSKFPSLAICASAARSCGHVLDVQTRRAKPLHNPHMVIALFDCAVMLLVNVWAVTVVGGRKSRGPHDFDRATADVQNYLRVLRLWRSAGRKCDIITAMLNIGRYTATADPRSPPKRPREATPGPSSSSSNRVSEPPVVLTLNPPAHPHPEPTDPVSVSQQMQALERSFQETESLFSLPLSTDELGRLPIYDSFDYQFTFDPAADYAAPDLNFQRCDSDPPPPVLFGGMDPGSVFLEAQSGSSSSDGGVVGQQIPLPPGSFGTTVNYQWDEWSAYLARVDGLTDPQH